MFCHAREDWSDLCGWLVSDPSWFSYRCYGGTVTNGPESGSYSAWLNTEADYTKVGSNGPWGWVSDAWISDDTTNVPGEWPQCDIYT
ncbi:hypothetical protein [Actinoallomurus sp. NPDC050550]|uniref:hypothetical protein n=1 Tax=Actinoallomurus sp. NPDC050550 TaxID=3154937 RepID=UPI0033D335CF